MCSCHRDPQASTIQDFNDEIEEFHHMNYKNVEINNCSASHYTILIQLGEDGINIRNFTFKNFVSLKLIVEGEIKENVSIQIANFQGVFGNVLGIVEIKGIVRCFDESDDKTYPKKSLLSIDIDKVDKVLGNWKVHEMNRFTTPP